MKSSKQILTVVLVLLVVLLGVVSLFIAFRLQQSQAPDDSAAGTLCGGYAQPGSTHCNTQEFPCGEYYCNSNGTWTKTGSGGGGACGAFPACRASQAPDPICGDNVCNGGESCSSCSKDCSGGGGCSGTLNCDSNAKAFCGNNTQDCKETGVDCGGACDSACTTTNTPLPYPYNQTTPYGNAATACSTNDWTIYECATPMACYTIANGCPNGQAPARVLKTKVTNEDLDFELTTGQPNCSVRQADCQDAIAGVIFRSIVKCGGDCSIAAAVVPTTAQCNETCNNSDKLCAAGLTCTTIGSESRCRLESNPGSTTCQPPTTTTNPTTVQCNETCNSTDRLCASGLTCTTVGSENRCRLPENPTSASCSPSTTPVVSVASTCPSGSTTPNAAISWTMGSYPAQTVRVDISTSPTFTTYWSKTVAAGTTSTNESGFTGSTAFNIQQATTYYVRVYLTTSQVTSGASSVNTATCTTVALQCIDLQENGAEPIATGAGNVMEYTFVYQNPATTNPYTNIKLRVGTESSPVGRNALSTSSTLVDDYNYTFDAVTSRHTYRFRWEAASTSGVAVPAATYEVRVLLDGTTAVSNPAECLESITLSQSVQPEPVFNIVKSSALVCEADGDVRINYTVTTTNIGSVTGVIDFVEDRYDVNAAALSIQPTNLNPAYGTIANGRITWVGDTAARTYTAGQSKTFTYSLTIPAANVLTFSAPGVLNQAKVQYDTSTTQDNSVTFDLRTVINCSLPTIPNTGIFDNPNMLILGLVSVLLGVVVYKSKFGYQISEKVVGSVYDSVNSTVKDVKGQINSFKPYEETIMDQMEDKAKGKRKSKRSKN